ncbi:MAG: glycerophosphodiester phosphodiesterase [Desulfovibrio sp.]|uniref:glycerophosphodiester phosphodiesterase n=1 Tax=Desulfovibrio sp. 7SRBS1 TaxID=3378064 RepID=UPI003B412F9A
MFFDLLPKGGYVCAHRGARSEAPENTMLAARAALDAKADFWELDVALTSDNALVVIHDDSLERTTDVRAHKEFQNRAPWPVHAFRYAELRRLDAGTWFHATDPFGTIAAGKVSRQTLEKCPGQRIPTLRDALEFSRDNNLPVNIEIKDQLHVPGDPDIVKAVHKELLRTGTREMALISSFNHGYLAALRRLDPEIPMAALVEGRHPDDIVRYLKSLGACGYHPDCEITDTALVRELADAGIKVTPYTVNDMDQAEAFLQAGCFAVTTDFPRSLRQRLAP